MSGDAKPVAARTRRSARLATDGKTRGPVLRAARALLRVAGDRFCWPVRGNKRALAWKGRTRRSGGLSLPDGLEPFDRLGYVNLLRELHEVGNPFDAVKRNDTSGGKTGASRK